MTFETIQLLLPIVLAVHDLDEYLRYDDFARVYPFRLARKLSTRRVFGGAAILLTIAVALLSTLTYVYKTIVLLTISKVAILAVMLNALGHCVLSLKHRALTPGTLSAVILVLPYSALAVLAMRTKLGDSFWSLVRYAAAGALAAPLAIALFLWVSYGLLRLPTRIQKP